MFGLGLQERLLSWSGAIYFDREFLHLSLGRQGLNDPVEILK
jgi:hypothetical protein